MRIINKVGGIENLNGVIDIGYKVENKIALEKNINGIRF